MRETGTRRRVVAQVVLVAIAAYSSAAAGQQTDEQKIRALSDDWMRAVAARDVDRIVAIHAPDAISMASNSPLAKGSAAIRTMYGGIVNTPGMALKWVPTRIDVVSPRVATEYGTYSLSYDGPQGKVNDAGNYSTIWHKVNGQWRVAVDATVSSTPMPVAAVAMSPRDIGDTQMMSGGGVTWNDLVVPGFDPGAKIAVLHGNPAGKDDYTVRLQFPDGYRFPVHWHPKGEHLTVLSGSFQLAMGNTADWSTLKTYAPGDFMFLPGQHAHFGGARGVTVIQLHGDGPFEIKLGPGK